MAITTSHRRTAELLKFDTNSELRVPFILTVLFAGLIPWLSTRPPMVDLPQHAGQVALWHDLAMGYSQWASLLTINYFTPYLFGYGCAFLLSFVMPVLAAMKLMLTLALYGFVWSCVRLRMEFDGDRRLDWLSIPGFFGFAYSWGLFTFLVTAPMGMVFMLLAHRYACRPTYLRGAGIFMMGLLLFFSHGLIFLFANAVGLALVILRNRGGRRWQGALWPFVLEGGLLLLFLYIRMHEVTTVPYIAAMPTLVWHLGMGRLAFLSAIWGSAEGRDTLTTIIGGAMLLAPLSLGSKFNISQPLAFVPVIVVMAIILLAPRSIYMNTLLDIRFSIFIPPLFALMYREQSDLNQNASVSVPDCLKNLYLPVLCWALLGVYAVRHVQFSAESADFEEAIKYANPGQRAVYLALDSASRAAGSANVYLHYALWYQVDRKGFVDPNFAWLMPQIVRFRDGKYPSVVTNFNEVGARFDWANNQGCQYRYIFVRNNANPASDQFGGAQCQVVLLIRNGNWSVYVVEGA